MKTSIAKINNVLVGAMAIFVVSGLIFLQLGPDWISKGSFLSAVFTFPLALATKGIQYITEKQLHKASISIIVLSLFCLFSLLFIFV